MAEPIVTELVLGGQKSGKTRRAEALAQAWLDADVGHHAVLLATAMAGDTEMAARIARHQSDRAGRLQGLELVEEPLDVAGVIARRSRPDTLIVVDCLTLWLTHHLMPQWPLPQPVAPKRLIERLCAAVATAPGPVVLVSNEIGLGVIPLGRETRDFVDSLGRLNQAVAAVCPRVTLVAAGLHLTLKTP